MHMRTVTVLVALILTLPTVVAAQTQSLAEASRIAIAQREAKKAADAKAGVAATPPPKTAYTTADLKPGPTKVTPSAPPPPPSGATESARQTAYQQSAKQDEGYWKGRMATLRNLFEADVLQVAALEARVDALSAEFNQTGSPTQRIVLRRERETAMTGVVRLRAVVLADRLAIATAEEEARRAGVPSGWLRP